MTHYLETRILCWNVRQWKTEMEGIPDFLIAEHILGIPGIPVGSTVKVTDPVEAPLLWDGKRVYEATAAYYTGQKGYKGADPIRPV